MVSIALFVSLYIDKDAACFLIPQQASWYESMIQKDLDQAQREAMLPELVATTPQATHRTSVHESV